MAIKKLVFDGNGMILGRLGTVVAKELLKGSEVAIINSENVLVSGKKENVVEKIRKKQQMGRGGSMKGPKYPRMVDRLLKRMIRGMLPWDKMKGREAYKRLKCYIGNGTLNENDLKDVQKLVQKKPAKSATMAQIVEALK